jgi:UDP-N-acetylmuramyl pentapeptide synthase
MITLSLSEICQAVDGQLIGKDITIKTLVTDSRALAKNDVFFSLERP